MRALFVSDIHLDESRPVLLEAFLRFLHRESRLNDDIYILGDLVEAWVGDDSDEPVASALASLFRECSERCDVHFMHGNRDFLIGDAFCRESRMQLLPDPFVLRLGSRFAMLSHGDAFCTADSSYQHMRKVLRSKAWRSSFLSRPLRERKELASGLRKMSREANSNKAANISDVVESDAMTAMEQLGCDDIIHGHTHRPGVHDLGNGGRRFVLGDWGRCAWVAKFREDLALECVPLRE